jgi:Holliday junction resolvase RusA-like endonuclease
MIINFEVIGKPVGKGRPKFARRSNFVSTYTPEKTRLAEQSFLAQALPYKPEQPLEGALSLVFRCYMPIPASWSKAKREQALSGQLLPTTKPDCTNIAKIGEDAMNGVFYHDDSQIARLVIEKEYGLVAKTHVSLMEITHRGGCPAGIGRQ